MNITVRFIFLHHIMTWPCFNHLGLIVIRNPFTTTGQRYWILRTLLDFPHDTNFITNMDNLNRLERVKKGESVNELTAFKLGVCSRDFYTKLRWVTFGYHHDWDTKVKIHPNNLDTFEV